MTTQTHNGYAPAYAVENYVTSEEIVLETEGYEERNLTEKKLLHFLKVGQTFLISIQKSRTQKAMLQKALDVKKYAEEQGIGIIHRCIFNKYGAMIAIRIWRME